MSIENNQFKIESLDPILKNYPELRKFILDWNRVVLSLQGYQRSLDSIGEGNGIAEIANKKQQRSKIEGELRQKRIPLESLLKQNQQFIQALCNAETRLLKAERILHDKRNKHIYRKPVYSSNNNTTGEATIMLVTLIAVLIELGVLLAAPALWIAGVVVAIIAIIIAIDDYLSNYLSVRSIADHETDVREARAELQRAYDSCEEVAKLFNNHLISQQQAQHSSNFFSARDNKTAGASDEDNQYSASLARSAQSICSVTH